MVTKTKEVRNGKHKQLPVKRQANVQTCLALGFCQPLNLGIIASKVISEGSRHRTSAILSSQFANVATVQLHTSKVC